MVGHTSPCGYEAEGVYRYIYYPPEISSMKYCRFGAFMKEYFRLVTK